MGRCLKKTLRTNHLHNWYRKCSFLPLQGLGVYSYKLCLMPRVRRQNSLIMLKRLLDSSVSSLIWASWHQEEHPVTKTLQIPLGSKFLTDLSTFKRLHFGMLYHTIFALILLNLILFSHYLLLNSTSSWKLTFFFIPILFSLASLYWTDPLELWFGLFVIHYSFHILHPRSVHLLNSF